MKRLLPLLLAVLSLGATQYVDSGCTNNGDGSAIDCAASPGGVGPWKALSDVAFTCGNTVSVRGVHSTHGANHAAGTTDGRYSVPSNGGWRMNKDCASEPSRLTIQAHGWTAVGAGTQEVAYVEGTAAPGTSGTLGWTQCSWDGSACDCRNPDFLNLTGFDVNTCPTVWWTDKNATGNPGFMNRVIGAQRPDGRMTYRERPGTACNGTSLNVQWDSCSAQTDGTALFVKWGTGADAPAGASNPKPYVFYDSDGVGFNFCGTFAGPCTYITVQGFRTRCFKAYGGFLIGDPATNIIARDSSVIDVADVEGNGSDYGAVVYGGTPVTLDSLDISYTGSEGIHTRSHATGTSAITISNVYIHNTGDQTVMGPGVIGTPSGMILAFDTGDGNGDYAGSSVSGSVIENLGSPAGGGSPGIGIILEDKSLNWKIYNNIVKSPPRYCMKWDGADCQLGGGECNTSVTGSEVYNNLFLNCGGNGLYVTTAASHTIDNNKFYNNTIVNPVDEAIFADCSGTCSNNIFRNNILYANDGQKMVGWVNTTSSNKFENNLVSTSANPAITWLNVGYSNANIDAGCSTNCTGCKTGDPSFVNASTDFHIQTGSPGKDSGTATGMPAGRTADINNTIAAAHGYASYADNQAIQGGTWDIGIDEFLGGGAGKRKIIVSGSDGPEVCR